MDNSDEGPVRVSMTPERWEQVNELFHSALGHEPDHRAAYLRYNLSHNFCRSLSRSFSASLHKDLGESDSVFTKQVRSFSPSRSRRQR